MIEKDMSKLTPKQQKKIVQGSVIPRPVAWVSSLNEDSSINLAPFSHFQMLSPTMVSISVLRRNEEYKDTARNILKNREAVIQITSKELLKQIDLTSKPLLANESEVKLTGLTLTDSKKVKTKGIKEAKIRLEVVLENHLELKDYTNAFVEADLLIFRVVYAHLDESVFDQDSEYILYDKLKPIARIAGPLYSEISVIKDFKRQF